ncbi:MAG: hypothetical protein J6S67_19365 [Methanobrevibacter sp.]|nr:hypothetical protein [Methanobrevibacter sp.]
MIEVKSRDVSKSMYDVFAKIKLSSEYGMMVKTLSDEDKELIKKAYKSEKSNVYADTDSSQLGG